MASGPGIPAWQAQAESSKTVQQIPWFLPAGAWDARTQGEETIHHIVEAKSSVFFEISLFVLMISCVLAFTLKVAMTV